MSEEDKSFVFEHENFRVAWLDGIEHYNTQKEEWVNGSYRYFVKLLNSQIEKWVTARQDDYQGEWFAVGINAEGYWFQQGSFGSCSGCDWLMGISDIDGALDFLREMKKLAFIGKTLPEALDYLIKAEGNTCWAGEELREIRSNLECEIYDPISA